ncbi:hypothetical protein EY643_13405 [Halioglobus maricola]|uniref:Photosynthesis system II assembly factor Ycf48/Hcf136-like domain-containing protein n=1 Tax=Halioglobus maricola TaxID=2601894 RepID=A0A5P9NL29_9GAMM|nr:YCF48-related protein [Halioglobus maricola]QFU76573.1 hypothetical protein EY643_13405 [Halioglobus maricola]
MATKSITSCVLLAFLSLAGVYSGAISAAENAPIMPLAQHSLLLDLAHAGDRVVVAGERGHVLFSDDRGATWTQAGVPTRQMLTALFFVDESRGWAVGHDGLVLLTDDGGASWRVQRDGLAAQQQLNLEARERAHREVGRIEAALAKAGPAAAREQMQDLQLALEDALLDLEDAELALQEHVFTSPLMDVWFRDAEHGFAVGAFGSLLVTVDGGQRWEHVPERVDNPEEFHLNAVVGDSQGRVFIAGEGGLLYRSLDGGRSFVRLEGFYQGSWFGALWLAKLERLLVYGLRGNLYFSDDFGDSWRQPEGGTDLTLSGGTASDDTVVVVGGAGSVLMSVNGGDSFEFYQIEDRLPLGAALLVGDRLILAGQGGVKYRNEGQLNE